MPNKFITKIAAVAAAVMMTLGSAANPVFAQGGKTFDRLSITSWPTTKYAPGSSFEQSKVTAVAIYSDGSKKTVKVPELTLRWNGYYKGTIDNMIGNKSSVKNENEGYITASYRDGKVTRSATKRVILYANGTKVTDSSSDSKPSSKPTTDAKQLSKLNITSWPSTKYGTGSKFETDKVAAEVTYSDGSKKTAKASDLKLTWNGYYKGSLDNMIGNKTSVKNENEGYVTVSYTEGGKTVKSTKRVIIYTNGTKTTDSSSSNPTATPGSKPTATPSAKPTTAPTPTAKPTTTPSATPSAKPATPSKSTTGTYDPAQYDGKSFNAPKAVVGDADTIVDNMTVGWNLGNTLESTTSVVKESALKHTSNEGTSYETEWGQPVATHELLKSIHDKGFNTIRIPVTWGHHLIDDGNGNITISKPFLDEVKRVVDDAYSLNMYVILDTHHDASDFSNGKTMATAGDTGLTWEMNTPYQLFTAGTKYSNESQCANVTRLWTAIANEFKDYDNRLMFEGLNEVQGDKRDWHYPTDDELTRMNNLNNAFVSAVRTTGGNNANRVLIAQTYAGYTDGHVVSSVDIHDTAKNAIIEEVHYYVKDTRKSPKSVMESIAKASKYPVIIGEFGHWYDYKTTADLCNMYYNYSACSKELKMPLIYWDDGKTWHNTFGLIDRKTLSWMKEGHDWAASALAGWYEN